MTDSTVQYKPNVEQLIERFGDNPSGFLALNDANSYYEDVDIEGVVCYRERRKFWIQFGGPLCRPDNRAELQSRFIAAARAKGARVIAMQLQHDDALLFNELGTPVDQMGASYAVDLTKFSLRGKKFVRLRNKISRARKAGLSVEEVTFDQVSDKIAEIDSHWLRNKGRLAKEMQFLIGEVGGPHQRSRRLFVGKIDDAVVGYISFAPAYGVRSGWLHDLSRRHPSCPPGVMESINAHAISVFQNSDVNWLHFGFTPFTGLSAAHKMPKARKSVGAIFDFLASHGEAVYPARTQLDYKLKWSPAEPTPEYLAFTGPLTPAVVWNLLRVLNIL